MIQEEAFWDARRIARDWMEEVVSPCDCFESRHGTCGIDRSLELCLYNDCADEDCSGGCYEGRLERAIVLVKSMGNEPVSRCYYALDFAHVNLIPLLLLHRSTMCSKCTNSSSALQPGGSGRTSLPLSPQPLSAFLSYLDHSRSDPPT